MQIANCLNIDLAVVINTVVELIIPNKILLLTKQQTQKGIDLSSSWMIDGSWLVQLITLFSFV